MKFKVGDRVRVYYRGNLSFDGNVFGFSNYGLCITEDGFYSGHDDNPFHPKQCRRLVKKKKENFTQFNIDLLQRITTLEDSIERIEDLEQRLTSHEADKDIAKIKYQIESHANDIKHLAKELQEGLFRQAAKIIEIDESIKRIEEIEDIVTRTNIDYQALKNWTRRIEENYANIASVDRNILKQLNGRIDGIEKRVRDEEDSTAIRGMVISQLEGRIEKIEKLESKLVHEYFKNDLQS